MMALRAWTTLYSILWLLFIRSHASPCRGSVSPAIADHSLSLRDGPVFPDSPPSCPICSQNYWNINSCAQAAPVLANFSMIIFNPGAFIDVIKCACTDTFQSAYPQCVDCFTQTNQTQYLDPNNNQNLPAVVDGMRKICALESSLLGGAATADGEVTPTTTSQTNTPTGTSSARRGAQIPPLGDPSSDSLLFTMMITVSVGLGLLL